jgi:ADP-heptose:LPS heptosyltransferase
VENVIAIRTTSAAAMLPSTWAAWRRIRRHRIDTCIDLEFFARSSAALAYLSGAERRVGFHARFGEGPYRGDLLTHRVAYNPHLHTATAFRSLAEAMLADPAKLPTFGWRGGPPELPPAHRVVADEAAAVDVALRDVGIPAGAPIVLLNANAGDLLPLRKWSEDNYVALAQRLIAEFPTTHILFTGGPDEAPRIAELAAAVKSPRCHSFAGRTSLRELLALYHRATVLVTNDSGPAHFAALTPIEVVVLFGPETPLLFAAPGPRTHVVWSAIACSPCVSALNNRQSVCRDNVCMRMITVDDVFARVAVLHQARA